MSDTSLPPTPPRRTNHTAERYPRPSAQPLRRTLIARILSSLSRRQPDVPATSERRLTITQSDWSQLHAKVASLREPIPYLAAVSWTCIGITVSAILALPVWLSADSELSGKSHKNFVFVTPLLIMIAISGSVIAVFAFAVGYQAKRIRTATAENVLAEMDAIYKGASFRQV